MTIAAFAPPLPRARPPAALLLPYPRTFFLGGGSYDSSSGYLTAFVFPVGVGGLATYGLQTDVLYLSLKNRTSIQERCEPFPRDLVPSTFRLGRIRLRHPSAALPSVLVGGRLGVYEVLAL